VRSLPSYRFSHLPEGPVPLSFQSSSPVTPLLADAVPSGYRCLAAPAGMWHRQGSEVLARTACRWRTPVAGRCT